MSSSRREFRQRTLTPIFKTNTDLARSIQSRQKLSRKAKQKVGGEKILIPESGDDSSMNVDADVPSTNSSLFDKSINFCELMEDEMKDPKMEDDDDDEEDDPKKPGARYTYTKHMSDRIHSGLEEVIPVDTSSGISQAEHEGEIGQAIQEIQSNSMLEIPLNQNDPVSLISNLEQFEMNVKSQINSQKIFAQGTIETSEGEQDSKSFETMNFLDSAVDKPAVPDDQELREISFQPIIYPPPPKTGGIAIYSEDLATLNEGRYLNDTIIDFYLNYVFNEKLSSEDKEKTQLFTSFFFTRLTQKLRPQPGDEDPKILQMRRHDQVKTWTRKIDLFSKSYIIIPINQHKHWFLSIICYPDQLKDEDTSNNEDMSTQDDSSAHSNSSEMPERSAQTNNTVVYFDSNNHKKEMPCILIFDSLSNQSRLSVVSTLREYLEVEWERKKGTKKIFCQKTIPGFLIKCPQQTNFKDCGLYLLQYVESFFENPIPYFGNPLPDLTNWFKCEEMLKKRQQLKKLILSLQKEFGIK